MRELNASASTILLYQVKDNCNTNRNRKTVLVTKFLFISLCNLYSD